METTKKSTRKSESKASDDRIKSAYINYLLTEGKQPASIFKFCLDNGMKEEEFYTFFGSFDALERSIWKGFIDKTINRLQSDNTFNEFSSREKVLMFYFALLEELRSNRSYVLLQLGHHKRLELTPGYLKGFRESFEAFFENILNQGKGKGEVATRPFLDKRYPQLFWLHMGFILTFWKEDDSAGFEKTDAAVEKSVNLAFDLIGKGAVDAAIDFGKFLYQNKR
ncbi:TetR family transcriptional regulator C-terminal domain-containing protein [Ohtaekwangia koreensis]|jgi:AcrR family transcriptional regulator|uniref:DNA-binding transcriptional regulator, AcrR family n=1 Tax=Ohtaekwangia koreensis TaxID=688867 RepID=A0A1T5M1Q2_9BACT|nr:TetR family transcriptional regulator C-terminal domain-containing protein [Ohtaekwangia koreensis]SKC82160.1 DNA-binding transcriptional regulator, AcrR family [Ohtaekwangia koreensis]